MAGRDTGGPLEAKLDPSWGCFEAITGTGSSSKSSSTSGWSLPELPRAASASGTHQQGEQTDRGAQDIPKSLEGFSDSSCPEKSPRCSYLQSQLEARPREEGLARERAQTAAGKGRRLLSEELDSSAIIQRDNLSLVLLLQGLQGTEQRGLIQAMEL